MASCRADQSTLITVLKRQGADGVVCLEGIVIDRRYRLAEHAGRSTIESHFVTKQTDYHRIRIY